MRSAGEIDLESVSSVTRELCEGLSKAGFALSDSDSFESMCDLAFWLYIDGKHAEAATS